MAIFWLTEMIPLTATQDHYNVPGYFSKVNVLKTDNN